MRAQVAGIRGPEHRDVSEKSSSGSIWGGKGQSARLRLRGRLDGSALALEAVAHAAEARPELVQALAVEPERGAAGVDLDNTEEDVEALVVVDLGLEAVDGEGDGHGAILAGPELCQVAVALILFLADRSSRSRLGGIRIAGNLKS